MEASLFDIERIEGMGAGEDFTLKANTPARLSTKHRKLLDCRLKLLLKEQQVLNPGEMKVCDTNIKIHPKHGWNLSTRSNPTIVGIHFTEAYLKDWHETYRVKVQITNMENCVKALPQDLCIGYLVMM